MTVDLQSLTEVTMLPTSPARVEKRVYPSPAGAVLPMKLPRSSGARALRLTLCQKSSRQRVSNSSYAMDKEMRGAGQTDNTMREVVRHVVFISHANLRITISQTGLALI